MTTWTLAHNLKVRADAVRRCWPTVVIGEVGDPKHLTEHSDHNPDARGIVHALDVMEPVGPKASAVLAWCLAHPDDLEYVIHNRLEYTRSHGFKPRPYTGSDPHTNHVHISGRHGSTGETHTTGTGYSTTAEAMSPAGSPCTPEDEMTPADWKIFDEKIAASEARILAKVGAEVFGFDPNVAGKGGIPTPAYQPDAKTNPTCSLGWMLGEINTNAHKAANPTPPPVTP